MGMRRWSSVRICSCFAVPVVALYSEAFVRHPALAAAAASRLEFLGFKKGQQQTSGCRRTPPILLLKGCSNDGPTARGDHTARQPRSEAPSTTASGILAPLQRERRIMKADDVDVDNMLLYFAFGANMCPSVLINKRGVKPFASLPAEAVKFATDTRNSGNVMGDGVRGDWSSYESRMEAKRGICTCFCHRAGYATLVQAPGPPQSWETSPGAHGVLHAISSADLNKIAGSENGYRKRMVEVETPGGDKDTAVCFVSNPSQTLPTSVPPTSRYLSLLLEGAEYHGVNEPYRSWLAGLPSVPPENEATSPERINTPSKRALDAILAATAVAAFGAAGLAVNPF